MNEDSKKNYRFHGKFIHLTYKSHIGIEDIKKMLKKIKKRTCKIKVAHETADKNHPYKHTHVLVVISKRIDKRNCNWADINNIHPNHVFVKTPEHFRNIYVYLDKENCILNELNIDDFTYNPKVQLKKLIQAHKKWKDVINDDELCGQIHNCLNWAKEVYSCRIPEILTKDIILRPFQNEILKILKNQNDREILWIYDKIGGSGKRVLGDWMLDNLNVFLCNNGSLRDVAFAFDNEEYVIFDIARTKEEFTPYIAMELFKDGRIFSGKYHSCLKRFQTCKVVVFANFYPDLAALSMDRWDIWVLDKLKLTKPKLRQIPHSPWSS